MALSNMKLGKVSNKHGRCDGSDSDTEEMDESQDPLQESGGTRSDSSDEEVDESVAEEINRFEETFKGISKNYRLINRIGEGTFSTVYKALDLHYDSFQNAWDIDACEKLKWSSPPPRRRIAELQKPHYVAIKKIYVTSSPVRIYNELDLLHDLKDCESVCPLVTAFRHQDQVIAVLPYFHHHDFRDYFRDFTVTEMRTYFHSLFMALKAVHDRNIIHRDIKPTNFLYSPSQARGVLVDFGLAEREGTDWSPCVCSSSPAEREKRIRCCRFAQLADGRPSNYIPSVPRTDNRAARRANRAGTRGFRAPEVLLKCTQQTTAIDIWSAGVVLLTLLSRRFPFFHSADDVDALIELATLFGRRKMRATALLHGQVFETNIPTLAEGGYSFEDLVSWCQGRDEASENRRIIHACSSEEKDAIEFMKLCFELDPSKRMTAEQALKHPFIRDRGLGPVAEDEMDVVKCESA